MCYKGKSEMCCQNDGTLATTELLSSDMSAMKKRKLTEQNTGQIQVRPQGTKRLLKTSLGFRRRQQQMTIKKTGGVRSALWWMRWTLHLLLLLLSSAGATPISTSPSSSSSSSSGSEIFKEKGKAYRPPVCLIILESQI